MTDMADILAMTEQMEHDRFFLKQNDAPWYEVTREQFIGAEQACGFRSKFGRDHVATAGFGHTSHGAEIQGRTISTKYSDPDSFQWDPEFRKVAWPDA